MASNNEIRIIAQTPYKSKEEWEQDETPIKNQELIVYTINNVPFFKIGNGINKFLELPEFQLNINNLYQDDNEYIIIATNASNYGEN